MIKIEEIRIGNWFRHNETWCYKDNTGAFNFQWDERDWYAVGELTFGFHDISPIVLTSDILIDAGFLKTSGDLPKWVKGITFMKSDEKEDCFFLCASRILNRDGLVYVKYVHQLQNLYYWLCGEELNIKL